MTQDTDSLYSLEQLDALTGGAFSAQTSSERGSKIRDWLSTHPQADLIQEAYKHMSAKDKGVSKSLRERLDELKRHQSQEQLIEDWALKGHAILDLQKFHIADALAWQRDAAKAGAPLSKEPLAGLKMKLFERIKKVEDLEHRAQVQRESAVMMAQRMEVLSTKPWREAVDLREALSKDVQAWVALKEQIFADEHWASVDIKYAPALSSSGEQMLALWGAFSDALAQAQKASESKDEALPQVPAWAEEIKVQRLAGESALSQVHKTKVEPELKAKASLAVQEVLKVLESEMAEGHGKASASAAQNLRSVLKENGPWIDEKLEHQVQAALAAASELEGWQKWRADQLRLELVQKAEGLFKKVAPKAQQTQHVTKVSKAEQKKKVIAPAKETGTVSLPASAQPSESFAALQDEQTPQATPELNQAASSETLSVSTALPSEDQLSMAEPMPHPVNAPESTQGDLSGHVATLSPAPLSKDIKVVAPKNQEVTWVPVMGGKKMQETLRQLREQWKLVDQGGMPNHALWKRFDQACNRAHKVVEAWVERVKIESAENKAQRLSLIEELKAWSALNAHGPDWKSVVRQLHHFSDRWRDSGHVSEKLFVELQALWKEAMKAAHAPLEMEQERSIQARMALIEQAKTLGAEPALRIDAVKQLQQRWQQESQSVVLDRKQEQKLWDAFRQPIDEAFERKTKQREQAQAAVSALDVAVVAASKAVEDAVAKQDAQAIRESMNALDRLLRGEVASQESGEAQKAQAKGPTPLSSLPTQATPEDQHEGAVDGATQPLAHQEAQETPVLEGNDSVALSTQADSTPKPAPKAPPRPVVAVRGDDRPGQKKATPSSNSHSNFKDTRGTKPRDSVRETARDRHPKSGFEALRGPRLGDQAFRAQRQAVEQAQMALKRLSALAHGESLTQLLSAWELRDAERVPALKELGSRLKASDRALLVQAIKSPLKVEDSALKTSLLRLEMASEQPTPAEHLSDRRALQLQLLTKRNDPSPLQTWPQDVATVLNGPYEAQNAHRLQTVLKVLMKKGA